MQWYYIAIICAFGFWLIYSVITSVGMYKFSSRPKKFSDKEQFKKEKEISKFDSARYDILTKEPFTLQSGDAVLKGYVLRNPNRTDKVAVIAHGFTASVINSGKYGEIFYDLGYDVVAYDERYFGQSTGAYCTMGYMESRDLLNVIKYVETVFDKPKIVLHGESMGAATALLALPEAEGKISYVVSDCAFSNCMKLYRYLTRKTTLFFSSFPITDLACLWNKLKNGYSPKNLNPIDAVRKTDVPILFIHGKADGFIPCRMSEEMFRAAKNPLSELYLTPHAKHALSYAQDAAKYKELIKNFDKKITEMEDKK